MSETRGNESVPQTLVTVLCFVKSSNAAPIRARLEGLGNPAGSEVGGPLDDLGRIHFLSLNLLQAAKGDGAHLVLEFSGDGDEAELLREVATRLRGPLTPIFELADGFSKGDRLADFWKNHCHQLRQGYFRTLGLGFCGAPGMTVSRIRMEGRLREYLGPIVGGVPKEARSLETLQRVRRAVRSGGQWEWALESPPPTPLLGVGQAPLQAQLRTLSWGLVVFLWPVMLIALFLGVWVWSKAGWTTAFAAEALLTVVTLACFGGLVYRLRQIEEADQAEDSNPTPEHYLEVNRREGQAAQNHLIVHTVLKPGLLRRFTLRLAFFAIGQLAVRMWPPGFLDTLGTIHFARWVLVPGTTDLLFFSNYGGSWESYLEDFITKAHQGLTAVWSNTVGFPRATFLIQDGATDGDRFKRWARRSQRPTQCWYSAYPGLTTSQIRNNAAIRQGLSAVQTEDEARHWLSLFGSAPAVADGLETSEIQGIFFGGFKKMKEALCLLVRLEPGRAAGEWLQEVHPLILFGDRQPEEKTGSCVILGLSAGALPKLGLPSEAIATFPNSFLQGMVSETRSRILGDVDANAPDHWNWGKLEQEIDGALLLYAADSTTLARLVERVESSLARYAHGIVARIPLRSLDDPDTGKEPFGFADGGSQPVVRGTFRSKSNPDPLHAVSPGEFLLGYPDNRGYFPATPSIPATSDPEDLLPLVPGSHDVRLGFANTVTEKPRDLGRNGAFLVLRQLEQDVAGFERAIAAAAGPGASTAQRDLLAAKTVGRWKNGSSLVRNPSMPDARGTVDNDFLFGAEDPQGLRCPFGAHIRRANPRESFVPGSKDQISITNRHRILRRGRVYQRDAQGNIGLLFACLNADLERQFEFVQQTWLNSSSFHGLLGEVDPLTGSSSTGSFTIPTNEGPRLIDGFARFISVRGGGYFFLPGKRTLSFLAWSVAPRPASPQSQ